MNKLSQTPLFDNASIQKRVKELSQEICDSYAFDVVVGILTGSWIFVSDLCKNFSNPNIEVKFIRVKSYGDSTNSLGNVQISLLDDLNIQGKKVLLIDDILDTGWTLNETVKILNKKNPKNIKTCVMLDKKARRKIPFEADFVGFTITDGFVVGYGLDFAKKYRCLPDLWICKPN